MERMISDIMAFIEDHPGIVITEQMVKDLIEYYKDEIAKEVMEQL